MTRIPDSALIIRHRRRGPIVRALGVVEAVVYYGAAGLLGVIIGAVITATLLAAR